ncbi:MAG TPA: ABC transporter ATP-binding protein [Burkholderiaceae bacterium]|nr:ABC transporter ATP-binding protein [Burkholderiaceae bacterium]
MDTIQTAGQRDTVLARALAVSKTFRSGSIDVTVLRDVTLQVRTGELVLLMGPSGSGKTTLLCVLSGLLRPSAGDVDLCGVPISRLPERAAGEVRRRNVGFVFQTYNLFPALSALDNVAEVLALKGMAREQARAVAGGSLAGVGLGARLDHRPGELSGGERQRVAIARALAGDPSLIFGDEPTAALDRQTGLEIVALLKQHVNEHRGVLLVTHDARLLQFADRVIEIDDGRIVRDEPVRCLPDAAPGPTQ